MTNTEQSITRPSPGMVRAGQSGGYCQLDGCPEPARARGMSRERNVSIAGRFGVAPKTISDIRTGKTWGHVR